MLFSGALDSAERPERPATEIFNVALRYSDYLITSTSDAIPSDVQAVITGLRSYNEGHAGPSGFRRVQLILRDPSGTVRGGLLGKESWDWLYVETLWVDELLRKRGFGTRLLRQAESEASARGRRKALLDTFEFQAPSFYERNGYRVFAILEDFPPGYRRYYLMKEIVHGQQ